MQIFGSDKWPVMNTSSISLIKGLTAAIWKFMTLQCFNVIIEAICILLKVTCHQWKFRKILDQSMALIIYEHEIQNDYNHCRSNDMKH